MVWGCALATTPLGALSYLMGKRYKRIRMKKYILVIGVFVVLFITLTFSILSYCNTNPDYTNIGNLIIIGITLTVLMLYAYDTNRLANIQQDINYTPNVVHQLTATEMNDGNFDIGFDLINISSFYVVAFLNIQMKCYNDELIVQHDAYYGKKPWNLPPNSSVHGHFSLNDQLLENAHRTLFDLRKTKEDSELLTMAILLKCTSHHNIELKCPEIKYHFVFDRNIEKRNWSGWVLNI
ncbi:MAG: hypothetical protein ABIG69_00010 [Bacteroidota bacterium]